MWSEIVRNELYKDCVDCLEGGTLLEEGDQDALREAFEQAFLQADKRLLHWCADYLSLRPSEELDTIC